MIIKMKSTSFIIIFLAIAMLAFTGRAMAVPVTLYDGSAIPNSQGWTQNTIGSLSGTNTVNVGIGTTNFTTSLQAMNTYAIDTGATNYVVSMRVKVETASWNSLDASLGLSAFGAIGGFLPVDRTNNLAITATEIKWGDGGTSHTINTTVFHEYALAFIDGDLDVYVDETFPNIIAGLGTSVLSRTGVSIQGSNNQAGIVVFGDSTNDSGVNSIYDVDFVQFESIQAVPEPATIALLGIGLAGLGGVALRRKSKKKLVDKK